MTETTPTRGCRWCGRPFDVRPGRGRPRLFCSGACRQKDFVSRLRSRDAGLTETELVITRAELEDLRDKLYVLECAIEDARRDLEQDGDPLEALTWIIASAEPLLGSPLGESST